MSQAYPARKRSAALFAAVLLGTTSFALPSLAQITGPASGITQLGVAVAPRLQFSAQEMALAQAISSHPGLAAFYGATGLKPVFGGADAAPLRAAVIAAISDAGAHGIPAARYDLAALNRADPDSIQGEAQFALTLARWIDDVSAGFIRPEAAVGEIHRNPQRPAMARTFRAMLASPDPAGFLAGLGPQDPRYRVLQRALVGTDRLTAAEGTPRAPEGLWRVGARDARLPDLRARLTAVGFDAQTASDPAIYDAGLAQSVADYQQAVGLTADGIAGSRTIQRLNGGADRQTRAVLIALERMRWMNGYDLNARHVWVNIPEFSVRIMDGGQQVFQTRAVVGKSDPTMRTPEFSDEMEHVVVNPRWNVPRSITTKEYLPRLQANRNAVSHIDVVDGRGNVIPRGNIDFGRYTATNFPFRMRQKPSDDNALGLVKFIFPNPWNIYLHDTPTKHLFGESSRAFSHGCVRVGDPFDLATALLSQESSDPRGMFDRALASGRETFLELTPHLPVHLVYFTAFPDEAGQIRYFSDVYGRDDRVWAAMEQAAQTDGLETRGENN